MLTFSISTHHLKITLVKWTWMRNEMMIQVTDVAENKSSLTRLWHHKHQTSHLTKTIPPHVSLIKLYFMLFAHTKTVHCTYIYTKQQNHRWQSKRTWTSQIKPQFTTVIPSPNLWILMDSWITIHSLKWRWRWWWTRVFTVDVRVNLTRVDPEHNQELKH